MHPACVGPRKLGLREKHRGWIGDCLKPTFGHRKDAKLIHRAKPVLDSTHHPKAGLCIAFKVKHRIDHVFQQARARKRTLFGDMANNENSTTRSLRPLR